MSQEVTLKSVGDFRMPIRLDKTKAEVVQVTKRGFLRVRTPGQKALRTINPESDIYEKVTIDNSLVINIYK